MTMTINQPTELTVSTRVIKRLTKLCHQHQVNPAHTFIAINFRDPDYSAKSGGYQPVEIALTRYGTTQHWNLVYISNFRYFGRPYPELDIELDFNFNQSSFFMAGRAPVPLANNVVRQMYKLWERNFLSYLGFDAYEAIKITSW